MGSYLDTYTRTALSNEHLRGGFTFGIKFRLMDELASKPAVQQALNALDAYKWDDAQAIRYIKEGFTKRQAVAWPKQMIKHNALMKDFRDALSYMGESALQENLINASSRSRTVDSTLGVRLDTHAKPSIYAERLKEIQKGKAKTKSCQFCKHRFETNKLTPIGVMFCSACDRPDPFGNATFSKKIESARKKLQKARDALEISHNALMKKCPFEYKICHAYPDDDYENMSNDPDSDPFQRYCEPICENTFMMQRGLHSMREWYR